MSFQSSPVDHGLSSVLSNFDSPLSSVLSSGNSSFCASEYSSTPPEQCDAAYFMSTSSHFQQQPLGAYSPSSMNISGQTCINDSPWTGLSAAKNVVSRKTSTSQSLEFVPSYADMMSCSDLNKVESYLVPGVGFSLRPTNMVDCPSESLHNRIFERGETIFGFLKEDQEFFMSSIQNERDSFLDYYFPRKKLDIDLRVMPTVYMEDKNSTLSLEAICSQPFSKLVIRSAAYGLPFNAKIQPCTKCRIQNHKQFISVSSFSEYGQLFEDESNQSSTLFITGQRPVNKLRLVLKYNCTQDHIKNNFKLNQHVLANTLTVIEVFDAMSELIARFPFRVRIVASPGRDLLKFLTNHLTPKQTGCVIGKCSHLGARWKLDKIKSLESEALLKCLDRFAFKDSIFQELSGLVSKSKQTLKRRIEIDESSNKERVEVTDDGCLLIRTANKAKLAKIKRAVEAIFREGTDERSLVGEDYLGYPVETVSMIKREPLHLGGVQPQQLISLPQLRGQVVHLFTGEKIITIK